MPPRTSGRSSAPSRTCRPGGLYQVTESTASRWVRRPLDAIAADMRTRLRARLALSDDTVDSVVRLVHVSLRRLLA